MDTNTANGNGKHKTTTRTVPQWQPFTANTLASAGWAAYCEASRAMDGIRGELRAQEQFGYPDMWLDPLELLFEGFGSGDLPWIPQPVPPLMRRNMKKGEDIPVQLNQPNLDIIRDRIRILVANSEYARSAIENRVNYAIGEGLTYTVEPDHRDDVPPLQVKNAQRLVDLFCEYNSIDDCEAEGMIRYDIEGEWIGRLFPQYFRSDDAMCKFRFVEPELLRSPDGDNNSANSYGILTDYYDVQDVKGYWIVDRPEAQGNVPTSVTDAKFIVHMKQGNYASSKRGRSPFYPVQANIKRVEQMSQSLSSLVRARCKIALLRKLKGISPPSAQALAQSVTATTFQDPITGQERNIEQFQDGQILTVDPNRVEYEYPDIDFNVDVVVNAMYFELRGVAASFQIPLWMLTAYTEDMAAYTASLVAESPSAKMFKRLQKKLKTHWGDGRIGTRRSVLWRFLYHCAEAGYLDMNWVPFLKIVVGAPTVETRDKDKEATQNKTYNEMKVKSRKTIQEEQGLDPEVETERLEEEAAADAEQAKKFGPPPGTPGQPGEKQPGEEERQAREAKDSSGHEHKGKGEGGGQFTSGGGGASGGGETEHGGDKKARTLKTRVTSFVQGKYDKLKGRYGSTGAKLVLLGMMAPLPGSSVLTPAAAEIIRATILAFRSKPNAAAAAT